MTKSHLLIRISRLQFRLSQPAPADSNRAEARRIQHVGKFNKLLADAKAKWPDVPEAKWPKEFAVELVGGYYPQVDGDCDGVEDATAELLAVIRDLPDTESSAESASSPSADDDEAAA